MKDNNVTMNGMPFESEKMSSRSVRVLYVGIRDDAEVQVAYLSLGQARCRNVP